jgi:hypothetical protein
MSNYKVDYSIEDIEKIMKVLAKHSLEDPECTHSFTEIMQETFEHAN